MDSSSNGEERRRNAATSRRVGAPRAFRGTWRGRENRRLASLCSSRGVFHLLRKSCALAKPRGNRSSARATRGEGVLIFIRATRERSAAPLARRRALKEDFQGADALEKAEGPYRVGGGRRRRLVHFRRELLSARPFEESSRSSRSSGIARRATWNPGSSARNRAARSTRSGSSRKTPGRGGTRRLAAQIGERAGGARERAVGQRERKRVHGEVAPEEVRFTDSRLPPRRRFPPRETGS